VNQSQDLLDQIVARIRDALQPERIILFGSRARGVGRPESDYDLLVIKESELPRYRRAAHVYTILADVPAEVDVIVHTPQEVQDWGEVPEAFVTRTIRTGRIVYERAA
jgi:predicted nucleotidyltransferase